MANFETEYTMKDLAEAEKMLKTGKYSLNSVAKYTGISRTTLAYRLLGKRDYFRKKQSKWRGKSKKKIHKRYKKYYQENLPRLHKRQREKYQEIRNNPEKWAKVMDRQRARRAKLKKIKK